MCVIYYVYLSFFPHAYIYIYHLGSVSGPTSGWTIQLYCKAEARDQHWMGLPHQISLREMDRVI